VNGDIERFGQVARELCLRLLVVFDRLASIEPGAPDIFQVFRSRALEVTRLERQVNSNASGSEAYGWLPPPLIGEGHKVQTAWLHDFLLDPYPIRPAVFLRMPKFNMSSAEATALANYFAAADNSEFPYTYSSGRDRSRLAALEAEYAQRPAEGAGAATPAAGGGGATSSTTAPEGMQRLDDAMKIIVNGNFCVKCHLVADFEPP